MAKKKYTDKELMQMAIDVMKMRRKKIKKR
jgi:hypothetical protein